MKEKQAVVGRTLTFRAWDKGNDIFRYFNFLETKDVNKFGLGMWEFRYLQQYTGLKDTNGVEIFEGDIVFDEDGEFSKTCVIQWNEESAGFFGKAIEDDDSYSLVEIDGEVIGNIYENPNLI